MGIRGIEEKPNVNKGKFPKEKGDYLRFCRTPAGEKVSNTIVFSEVPEIFGIVALPSLVLKKSLVLRL